MSHIILGKIMTSKWYILFKTKVEINFFIHIYIARKKHFLALEKKLNIINVGRDDIYHCVYGKFWLVDTRQ
jgi:hypothetical protein